MGIGAQRSGTTWFVDLLTQHPQVSLGRSGRKELHSLVAGLIESPDEIAARIAAEFDGVDGAAGEFTPAYLRCPWVPGIAQRVLPDNVLFFVLVRDPIDRFTSAMAHESKLARWRIPAQVTAEQLAEWWKFRGVDAVWAGMYATHLRSWTAVFPKDRFHVIQYEAMTSDPENEIIRAWAALGLEPVPLKDVRVPSTTTTAPEDRWDLNSVPGLKERLIEIYRPELESLAVEWGIDVSRWHHFTD